MFIAKHSIETLAPAWALWKILIDVSNWSKWDHAIEYSSINGPFIAGTTGDLKFKDSPPMQTKLIKVEPMKMFVQETKIILARVVMSHFLHENNGKTIVTFQTDFYGPLAFVWRFFIGQDIKKKLPIEMSAMIEIAQKLNEYDKSE